MKFEYLSGKDVGKERVIRVFAWTTIRIGLSGALFSFVNIRQRVVSYLVEDRYDRLIRGSRSTFDRDKYPIVYRWDNVEFTNDRPTTSFISRMVDWFFSRSLDDEIRGKGMIDPTLEKFDEQTPQSQQTHEADHPKEVKAEHQTPQC